MACPKGCGCNICTLKKMFAHDAIILESTSRQVVSLYKMDMLSENDMTQLVLMCKAIVEAYALKEDPSKAGAKAEPEADGPDKKGSDPK